MNATLTDRLNQILPKVTSDAFLSSVGIGNDIACASFFKDHLQAYKKRPIYWLFSSGKQKAFQCLVCLHRLVCLRRYNEGTLSRMRGEYAIPLQGKMATRLEKLQGAIQAATSMAQSKRLEKEREKTRQAASGAPRFRREATPLRRHANQSRPR